jgi:hypothetical protein
MFRALLYPSSGARQTAVAASGFRTNVEVDVFPAVVGLLVGRQSPYYRRCSTCFGHYYAHHQEPQQTAFAASGFRMNAEVDVFPAVAGLLVGRHCLPTNKPTIAGNTSTSGFIRNQRLQRQFGRTPDDGHNNARNM